MINRRHFIQSLGVLAGASILPTSTWAYTTKKNPSMTAYLGAVPASDLETRLGIAKELEFKSVSAPANWYEQVSCKEINAAIRKAGLNCPVAYVPVDMLGLRDLEQGLDRLTTLAKRLGIDWLIAVGVRRFPRKTATMAEYLNLYAQRLSAEKIQFAYAPTSADLGGNDRLASLIVQTEPSLVHFEWDPALMEHAGADAMKYLTNHTERFKVLRVAISEDVLVTEEEKNLDWEAVRRLIKPSLIVTGAINSADANLTEAKANREFWDGIKEEKLKKEKAPKEKEEKLPKEKKAKVKKVKKVKKTDSDEEGS